MKFLHFIILFGISSFCFGQKEIVFEKKISLREYSIPLPYPCTIKLKNGKKQTGIIYKQNDRELIFKTIFKGHSFINDTIHSKKIMSDTSLSRKERVLHMLTIAYPDSEIISCDSIKKFHFDLFYKKNGAYRAISGLAVLSAGFLIYYGSMHSGEFLEFNANWAAIPCFGGYLVFRKISFKNIQTKKWNLKKAFGEYDVINLD